MPRDVYRTGWNTSRWHQKCAAVATVVALLGVASLAPAQQRRGWGNGGERDRERRAEGATTSPTSRPADAYAAVVERNIFVRERKPPVVVDNRPPASRPYVPPPTLESLLVLRGVVLEEDSFHAYFENTQSNEMVRVTAGDPLARGRVADISIDAVEFETAAGPAWIKIGDNLAGARVAEPTPSASSSSSSTQPSAAAATTTNPALMSIEERMRQRRQQRSGGR